MTDDQRDQLNRFLAERVTQIYIPVGSDHRLLDEAWKDGDHIQGRCGTSISKQHPHRSSVPRHCSRIRLESGVVTQIRCGNAGNGGRRDGTETRSI